MDSIGSPGKPHASELSVVQEETKEPAQVDSALRFLHEAGPATHTAEEEKALLRKVDWMIMPLASAVYFLQFMDKNIRE